MKISQKNLLITTVTLCAAISVSTLAFAADKAQDKAAEYRQGTFTMVAHHLGALGAMVKGEVDFDAATYKKNADAIAALTTLAPVGFEVEGTSENSTAKANIWEDKEGFAEKMTAFQVAGKALAEAADSGEEKTAKAAFGDFAKTCKACHSEFRSR